MPLETNPEPQPAQPVEGQPRNLALGEQRSLMDVWRVVTKQRYTILTVAIFSFAASAWYAIHTPPVYETVARIEIEPNQFAGNDMEAFFEADENANSMQTEVRILESDSVLFQTAENLHLQRLVRSGKSGRAGSPASSTEITTQERSAMVGFIKGGLSVSILPETRIVEIHYRSTDAKLATQIINELVETYSDQGLKTKFERTQHVSTWLQQRLEDLKKEASDTQQQLADYEKAHNIVGANENSNLTIQTLEDVSHNLDDAEADRIMKEARMRDFNTINPDMVALLGDDPTVAALHAQLTDLQTQRAEMAGKYGPKYPPMQQLDVQISKVQTRMNDEVAAARHQVQQEYESAVGLEGALRNRLAEQEDAAYRLNENVAQYSILRHQAELTRNLYDTLQMRLEEASVSAGLSAANITVVDHAQVPFVPIAPRKRLAMAVGLIGGLLFGCVLAFVIESIDDRLQTSEEVESASLLPALAAIPHMSYDPAKKREAEGRETSSGVPHAPQQLITIWDPKSNSAEAYRSMRSALLLSSIDNPPRVIVVTSAFPTEGKTTTAVNLAIVLAQRNERVLLVDADLRRGSLHRVFGLDDQSAGVGLSSALSQPELRKEAPAPFAELPTLHVMATGPRPPNPAEMLSSNRMEEQVRQWTHHYDRIVMDSAPLLAVSDTQALAARADAVVLVARAGVTRKRALIRARDLLWRINAPVAGVVVNDVDLRLENFYTYRYGMYTRDYWYAYRQSVLASNRAYGYEEERAYGYEEEKKEKGE